MHGWMLLIVVVSTPMLCGCGVLQTPGTTSDSWLTRARRQLAQVAKDIERDKILTAEQAKEYGIIDAVISSRKA
jgi:ATP-dependent Clp protease protease subunit